MPENITQDCSFCGASPESWRGVVQGPGVNICADCVELARAILTDPRFDTPPRPEQLPTEGIGDDVRLRITSASGPLLDESLIALALRGRAHGWNILPAFVYRDPQEPDDAEETDEPDEPRPLRRARLAIVEYGPIPAVAEQ